MGAGEDDAARASAASMGSSDRRVEALERIEAAPAAGDPPMPGWRARVRPSQLAMVVVLLAAASAAVYVLRLERHAFETVPDPGQGAIPTTTRPIRAVQTPDRSASTGSPVPQGADGAARGAVVSPCPRSVAALGLCDPARTTAGVADAGAPGGRDAPRAASQR